MKYKVRECERPLAAIGMPKQVDVLGWQFNRSGSLEGSNGGFIAWWASGLTPARIGQNAGDL